MKSLPAQGTCLMLSCLSRKRAQLPDASFMKEMWERRVVRFTMKYRHKITGLEIIVTYGATRGLEGLL